MLMPMLMLMPTLVFDTDLDTVMADLMVVMDHLVTAMVVTGLVADMAMVVMDMVATALAAGMDMVGTGLAAIMDMVATGLAANIDMVVIDLESNMVPGLGAMAMEAMAGGAMAVANTNQLLVGCLERISQKLHMFRPPHSFSNYLTHKLCL